MRAKITTTITTELDLDTMQLSHAVDVEDHDGLSQVSRDVLGTALLGALLSSTQAVRDEYPGAAAAERRAEES